MHKDSHSWKVHFPKTHQVQMSILNIEIISFFYIKIRLEIVPLKQSLKFSAFNLWNVQDDIFIKRTNFCHGKWILQKDCIFMHLTSLYRRRAGIDVYVVIFLAHMPLHQWMKSIVLRCFYLILLIGGFCGAHFSFWTFVDFPLFSIAPQKCHCWNIH
jgi:hypothetical protein